MRRPFPSPFASSLLEAEGQPVLTGCGQPATACDGEAQVFVVPASYRLLKPRSLKGRAILGYASLPCFAPATPPARSLSQEFRTCW